MSAIGRKGCLPVLGVVGEYAFIIIEALCDVVTAVRIMALAQRQVGVAEAAHLQRATLFEFTCLAKSPSASASCQRLPLPLRALPPA